MSRPDEGIIRHRLFVPGPHGTHILNSVLAIPLPQPVEIPAFLRNSELSKGNFVLFNPSMWDNIYIGATRQALKNHVKAVL